MNVLARMTTEERDTCYMSSKSLVWFGDILHKSSSMIHFSIILVCMKDSFESITKVNWEQKVNQVYDIFLSQSRYIAFIMQIFFCIFFS